MIKIYLNIAFRQIYRNDYHFLKASYLYSELWP